MSEELTAALLSIASHAERIGSLDYREAEHWAAVGDQLSAIATTLAGLRGTVSDHGDILRSLEGLDVTVAALAAQLTALTASGGPPKTYQPIDSPRWWQLTGDEREAATDRLRAWVSTVFRPGFGILARSVADCWDRHDLCLYLLDILSELHSVLYLDPRGKGTLSGQAEYMTRLLPAACELMALETSGRACDHAKASANGHGGRPS